MGAAGRGIYWPWLGGAGVTSAEAAVAAAVAQARGVKRFPDTNATPRTLEDALRVIRSIQNAKTFTVPRVAALPVTDVQDRFVVLDNSVDAVTLNWWDGAAWRTVNVT